LMLVLFPLKSSFSFIVTATAADDDVVVFADAVSINSATSGNCSFSKNSFENTRSNLSNRGLWLSRVSTSRFVDAAFGCAFEDIDGSLFAWQIVVLVATTETKNLFSLTVLKCSLATL